MDLYLKPTRAIDSDNKEIIKVARGLTISLKDEREKAIKLFYFVRDEIQYSVYMISTFFEDFIASTILARKKGYCVQKALLLVALARAIGIPAKLAFAKIKNHRVPKELVSQTGLDIFPSHGYTQLLLDGKWVSVTPAFDRYLCEQHDIPTVEFDGVNDAALSPYDLSGRPYIEYLEKYESHADLPFEWLRSRVIHIWGEKRSWLTLEDSKGHKMPSGYIFK